MTNGKTTINTATRAGITALALVGFFALAILATPSARGHDTGPEFIEAFDTRLELNERGALAIRHVIDVHPHGDEIRRGLFFELPDHIGPLSEFSASLNDEPIALDFDEGALVVAADEPLAIHQSHRFTVNYQADSPWWLGTPDTARLRWDPIIARFDLAWRDASLVITWPEDFRRPELPEGGTIEGNTWTRSFHGPLHGDGADSSIDRVELRTAASTLAPRALRRWGEDGPLRALLIAGLLGLLGFLHGAWRAVGRDPDPGVIAPRNRPPDGLSPAATRFVDRMGFDETVFVAALVSLRVKLALELTVDADKDTLRLQRQRSSASLSPGEQALVDSLFEDEEDIELGPGDKRAAKASDALKSTLGKEHRGRHFVLNSAYRNWGIVLGLLLSAVSITAMIMQARDALSPDRWVVGLGFTGLLVSVVAPLIYFELFKAPTRAGTRIKGQIAGLKRYFEEDSAPVSDAKHFVELLPYAAALNCEEAWRDRFVGSDESGLDQETADVIAWYREIQRRDETIAVLIPIMAGATASHTATASAGGGASAGGV